MVTLNFHFNENEGSPEVLRKSITIDAEGDLEEFLVNTILKSIGPRSLCNFSMAEKNFFLTHITDQNNKVVFWNAGNI